MRPIIEAPTLTVEPSLLPQPQTWPVRLTASGSEYFRIWVVNLLLILVTLTLYLPFARARKLAYFQGNTLIGDTPLAFVGDPWKMFRGYLVVLVTGVVYYGASEFAPSMAWIPLLLMIVLWPMLWRSSLRFRLRNTVWRGIRFDFQGSMKGAYLAMIPLALPWLLPVLAGASVMAPENEGVQTLLAASAGLGTLVFVLLLPWLYGRMKGYQHGGYTYTQERTQFDQKAYIRGIYGASLKGGGLLILCFVIIAAAGLILGGQGLSGVWTAFGVLILFSYLILPLLVWPYFQVKMHNLLWNNTRSAHITFKSQLHLSDYFGVTLRNWILIALTLGLYWPFATVNIARLKLEALSLETSEDLATWLADQTSAPTETVGDAAGDFLGIDVGL